MARLESQAVAGYYPTPAELLSSLASLISWRTRPEPWRGRRQHLLFDPCAGEGEAIICLRAAWWGTEDVAEIAACEMEASRAAALARRLRHFETRLHADAFTLVWRPEDAGASLLYLNPPYDTDPVHGRLEERFLDRFKGALAPGGALMFVVPVASLAASASTLARGFTDHRVYRFPDPHYADFRQCVLVARRVAEDLPGGSEARRMIETWAASPSRLAPLPDVCSDPLAVAVDQAGLHLTAAAFDHQAATAAFKPWDGAATGTDLEIGDLIGRAFPTAMPPKPAHLALALAAGHFNGHRLEANDPDAFPPVLVKGVYTRELAQVEERTRPRASPSPSQPQAGPASPGTSR